MDTESFWRLLEDVCQLGEFIASIETKGAEINIVGRFHVAHDGLELVVEKQNCNDRFHLAAEKIQGIHFGYCEVTTGGGDPCIELINVDGQSCLKLFYYPYQASELRSKYEQFMAQHHADREVLTGEWLLEV